MIPRAASGLPSSIALHGCVEHQRDPGEVLDRPVVEEEREPAPLVLLGRDDPLDEPLALVGGDLVGHQSIIASRTAARITTKYVSVLGLELREDVAHVRP